MQMEDDMISLMSDEILSHILSFLPTEDAFTTSLLSKRWVSVWLLVPTLDLDFYRFLKSGKSISQFLNLVIAAIFKRSVHHQPIKRFRLICDVSFVDETLESGFKTCLAGAAEHKLEHLEIQLDLSLPCCIYSLRNLVVLRLKELCMHTFSNVDFPLLKSLLLNHVRFGERMFFIELLNGCPILEDFEAEHIKIGNSSISPDQVITCLPKLVRANISNSSRCDFPLEPLCSVESLRFVEMFGNVPVFHNLTHVHLVYFTCVYWKLVFDVLKNCPMLQNFDLEMPPFFTSICYHFSGSSILPECLSLLLQKCTIENFIEEEYAIKFVQYIMLNSTSLQMMTISFVSSMDPQMKLELQQELLSFPKSSATCQIYIK